MSHNKDYIATVIDRIKVKKDLAKIILFGSQARGNAKVDSDFDFLIVFKEIENKRKQTIEILKQLSDLPIAKDIVVCTLQDLEINKNKNWTIISNALKEGLLLYESR